jgi:hypothetical protein
MLDHFLAPFSRTSLIRVSSSCDATSPVSWLARQMSGMTLEYTPAGSTTL